MLQNNAIMSIAITSCY